MRQLNIKNKNIYIVDKHNEILEAWEFINTKNVFCLDRHADSNKAFENFAYYAIENRGISSANPIFNSETVKFANELIENYRKGNVLISDCIKMITHMEHIDFAVRSGILDYVFIFGAKYNLPNFNDRVLLLEGDIDDGILILKPIIQYSPGLQLKSNCVFNDFVIESCYLNLGIDKLSMLLPDFFENFIFDIDLDFFNTKKSIEPNDFTSFKKLIINAKAISISMERDYVNSEKLAGELIDSDYLLKKLTELISDCLG